MKKIATILSGVLFVGSSFAQTIEINPSYGAEYGGGVEVDLNNNGHLDLIFGGNGRTKQYLEDSDGNQVETEKFTTLLMYNPSTKKFEPKPTNLLNAGRANFIVADFNGDGIMDIVATGHNRDIFYQPGIYEGKGDGTFTKKTLTFDDDSYAFRPVTVNVADFNNDGLPDIVAIGYEKIGNVVANYSAVLINKGNYSFNVTNTELLHDYELALVTVKVFDHNNDGYMDFFVSGNCDNPASNNGARVLADVFENLGEEEPGTFYRLFLGDGSIFQKANGGLDIADFNSDGWLDFAIHGEGGTGTGEPASGDAWRCISHVYVNQKNGTYTEKVQPNFSVDIRPLNSSGTSTRTFDWNGDGKPDIFIPGWNPAPETGTQAGFFWLNDGTGTFNTKTRIPGGSEAFILFPDWNGDGKRDYFMSGQSWDATYFATDDVKGRTSTVLINEAAPLNERPSAPTGLSVNKASNKITLSWSAATDKETPAAALSYEYYLKKDGKFYNSCRSHVGGQLDGVRKVLDLGNAMLNKSIALYNLPDGVYEWGVQAIDASFDGSVFAAGASFTVGTGTGVGKTNADLVGIYVSGNQLKIDSKAAASVKVFAATGALVSAKDNVAVYTTVLSQGIYIVEVTVDGGPVVRKVIVK
ncbi:MAG: T9SS type A sorting domain-containing protein [Breznakibacter sp.]